MSEVVTPQEYADEQGVSYDTIINLIKLDQLPFYRIGRQWRARRSDLDKLVTGSLPKKFVKSKAVERQPWESKYGG